MAMTQQELEAVYDKVDPWGYQTNPADIQRKKKIIDTITRKFYWLDRVLDVGCGEGWITQDLPADAIYGIEASKQAKSRWHPRILESPPIMEAYLDTLKLDLIVATGVIYENYAWEDLVRLVDVLNPRFFLTSNIAGREYWPAIERIKGELIHFDEFPYHRSPEEKFTQRLRIYKR